MVRTALLCSALLAVSAAGNAADVHKCATPSGVTYQGLPCDGPEMPTSIVAANAAQVPSAGSARTAPDTGVSSAQALPATSAPSARGAPECGARTREAPRLPWRQATICIGMTDDEVLNLPGWGRPAKISRTRAPREWREEWFYDARAAGPRQLFFVNGKLAVVETESTDTTVGSMASLAPSRGQSSY